MATRAAVTFVHDMFEMAAMIKAVIRESPLQIQKMLNLKHLRFTNQFNIHFLLVPHL